MFVDNSHSVRVNGIASVATARDSATTVGVISDNVITAASIHTDAITAAKIATNAIGATELAANCISHSEIAENAIGASEIASNAIGAAELATGCITSSEIASNAITAQKIATDAITHDKIAANAITDANLATDCITNAEIAASAIGESELAANCITSSEVATSVIAEVWDADSATYLDDNTGTIAYALQQILDSLGGQGWAAVGAGSDSASNIGWTKLAIWGIPYTDGDSSEATERHTASCIGTGNYSCTLTVLDTADNASVAGVTVSVNNQTENGTVRSGKTTVDGYIVFQLDNGNYRGSASAAPGVYAATDFTISNAALHDSILGYLPTIDAPASASMATVYGDFIVGNHDTLVDASVIFELVGATVVVDTSSDRRILPKLIKTTTNANGHVEIDLLKNENLIVTSGTARGHPWWQVTIEHSLLEMPQRFEFFIDCDSTTFNLGVDSEAIKF